MLLSESQEQLKSSSCRICRLLANIKPPSLSVACWDLALYPAFDASFPIPGSSNNLISIPMYAKGAIQVSRPD